MPIGVLTYDQIVDFYEWSKSQKLPSMDLIATNEVERQLLEWLKSDGAELGDRDLDPRGTR